MALARIRGDRDWWTCLQLGQRKQALSWNKGRLEAAPGVLAGRFVASLAVRKLFWQMKATAPTRLRVLAGSGVGEEDEKSVSGVENGRQRLDSKSIVSGGRSQI